MVSKQDADERTAESHAKNATRGVAQAARVACRHCRDNEI